MLNCLLGTSTVRRSFVHSAQLLQATYTDARPIGSPERRAIPLAGDDAAAKNNWFGTLATQEFSKESLCGALITMRLDQNVDHVAVLIHGAPQIPLLAVDSNEDFIQMPVVAQPSLSSIQSLSIVETELLTPLPDGFIGYDDAALGEKIFDIPETQAKR